MTTYYAKAVGSILANNAWNTLANGTGTDATFADGNATGHVLDLNALAMTSPTGTTLTCTTLQATTGTLTPTGTLTINANVTYSGTSTSGMLIIGTDVTLTINGQLTCSAAGYAIVATGNAIYHVTNVGDTAVSNTSIGRCISSVSTETCTVTGAVSNTNGSSSSSSGITHTIGTGTINIAGNIITTSIGGGVSISAGIVNVTGCLSPMRGGTFNCVVVGGGGTLNWSGNHTCAPGTYVGGIIVSNASGPPVINLGVEGSPLVITNTGGTTLLVMRFGTVNTTYFTHTRTTAASQFAFVGSSAFVDTGPVIPAAADVETGVEYGYSGDLQTGTMGGTTYFVI